MKLGQAFAARADLEQEGVWIPVYGPKGDKAEILLARAGGRNSAYDAAMLRAGRPHRRLLEAGMAPPQLMDEILAEVYAETVVKGWRGLEDEDGNPIPYSRAKAAELLRAHPDFCDFVRDAAMSAQTFTRIDSEVVAKG